MVKISVLLKRLSVAGLLVMSLLVFSGQPVAAAPYGSGSYDTSCYSDSCEPANNSPTPGASSTTGTPPNTGLDRQSLVWAGVSGLVGFSLVSFVIIRTIHIRRAKQ